MRVALATDPGTPGWPNEDFAAVAPERRGPARRLHHHPRRGRHRMRPRGGLVRADPGHRLPGGDHRRSGAVPLADALAGAIGEVRSYHESTCDLANPATPAATVTAVRAGQAGFEMLALSDSSIVADYGEDRDPVVLTDPHRAASTNPGAAWQARTTVVPQDGLHGIALLSDGATRITEVYRLIGWPDLVAVIRDEGPAGLIRQVRAAEDSDPDGARWPRFKARDDATAIYWSRPGGRDQVSRDAHDCGAHSGGGAAVPGVPPGVRDQDAGNRGTLRGCHWPPGCPGKQVGAELR